MTDPNNLTPFENFQLEKYGFISAWETVDDPNVDYEAEYDNQLNNDKNENE